MAAVAGFDFVLVDCEHGPADVVALRQHIAVAAVHGVPVVVRVGEDDAGMILRALDQGAEGILAPHIDSAADARALVSAAHYPPIGTRGFATYSRAGRFGQTDPAAHRDWFLANTLVLGMIESPAGVAAAREIVGTPGLDGDHDRPGRPGSGIRSCRSAAAAGDRTGERGDRRRRQAPHGHRGHDRSRGGGIRRRRSARRLQPGVLTHGASEGAAGSARLTQTRGEDHRGAVLASTSHALGRATRARAHRRNRAARGAAGDRRRS